MLRQSADIQYGYIKGFVNLTCEAEAAPPATFKWYRKNKHLHPRHHHIVNGEHISILQVQPAVRLIRFSSSNSTFYFLRVCVCFFQLYLNNTKLFGEYICEANNSLGTLRRTITLLNGTKPPAPPYVVSERLLHVATTISKNNLPFFSWPMCEKTLRGVNSKTFDLDVGAQKIGPADPMDIIGYRFEILSKDEHRNNGGKWLNARVVHKEFIDGT